MDPYNDISNDDESRLRSLASTAREKYLSDYQALISQYPILNYIRTANPDRSELWGAAMRLRTNGRNELRTIRAARHDLNRRSFMVGNPGVLDLLDYTTVVHQLIRENPRYCTISHALQNRRERREMNRRLLISAPILAASFIAPPLTGIALAGVYSASTVVNAQEALDHERRGAYISPTNMNGEQRSNHWAVEQARDQLQRELLYIPYEAAIYGAGSVIQGGASVMRGLRKSQD
jgi:hypothetical protein